MIDGYQSEKFAHSLVEDTNLLKKLIERLDLRRADKVLDIGCNRGFFVKKIQELSPNTFGIDINEKAIAGGLTTNLSVMDSMNLEFEDSSFDKVYSTHVIEHVTDPEKMLKEIERVLRPGGKAVIIYPAEPIRGLFALRSAWVMFKNPFRARDIHINNFNPKKMELLIKNTKLEHLESDFSPLIIPQYFTILQKRIS